MNSVESDIDEKRVSRATLAAQLAYAEAGRFGLRESRSIDSGPDMAAEEIDELKRQMAELDRAIEAYESGTRN